MIDLKTTAPLLVASLGLFACQGTGEPTHTGAPIEPQAIEAGTNQPGETTEPLAAEGLAELQPADIAVAPIDNLTGLDLLPTDELRQALAQGLIERLYSPLSIEFVDRHWVNASFQGADAPDATLFVTVTGWNDGSLTSKGELAAGLELRLVEGPLETGRLLWGRRMERVVDVADSGSRPAGLRKNLFPRALDALVREALAELPERDLKSAPRD